MTYQVTHTDSTNPLKPPYQVKDGTLNNETSLQFVGRGYPGFAPVIANNFLHLLENFASPATNPPTNPLEGQLWFDTTNKLIKVYDGAVWNEAGSIKKSPNDPGTVGAVAGDLWANTATSQLYIYSGSSWILVGPQFSEGLKTGPVVEVYTDTNNVSHNVLSFYASSSTDANEHILAIVSKDAFTPKTTIVGFATIYEGINLSSVNATNASIPTRFYGTAQAADNLLINNTLVQSINFLRSDTPSTTNYPLSIQHNSGISIGKDKGFNIAVDKSVTQVISNNSGSNIDFILTNSGGKISTVMHVDQSIKIGLGTNNTSPSTTLDVAGTVTIKDDTSYPIGNDSTGTVPGKLIIQGTTESTSLGTGSIVTSGGLSVAKYANFGSGISTRGVVTVSGTASTAVLVPDASQTYDIGTASLSFRNIYAQTFHGSFDGTFTGAFTGTVSGSATQLANSTSMTMTGDVTSPGFSFNGAGDGKTFTTTLSSDVISGKTAATDSLLSDYFLLFRQGTGLLKMSKKTLLSHVATMPIGTILPFGGTTAPAGYFFCDGSEVQISQYPDLFAVIGYNYKATTALRGLNTYGLPDLRGRFPLGKDNMTNNITVPSKDGSGTQISTGGGASRRVSDVTGSTLGGGNGLEAVGASTTTVLPSTATGKVPMAPSTFTVMNPYQTVNYIIFHGVL